MLFTHFVILYRPSLTHSGNASTERNISTALHMPEGMLWKRLGVVVSTSGNVMSCGDW